MAGQDLEEVLKKAGDDAALRALLEQLRSERKGKKESEDGSRKVSRLR